MIIRRKTQQQQRIWTRTFICITTVLFFTIEIQRLLGQQAEAATTLQRPQLVNATAYEQSGDFYDVITSYTATLTSLEFDQDLYTNFGFLCPLSEEDCSAIPRTTPASDPALCKPCDWSSNNGQPFADGCGAQCCGPFQYLDDNATAAVITEWCEPTVNFTTLQLPAPGQPPIRSRAIKTLAGESTFFRFFLPEDRWCSPVRIIVRHAYGNSYLFYSNRYPLPSIEAFDWFSYGTVAGFGFAQSFVDLCPNYQPFYSAATYSLNVFTPIDSEFTVELFVGDPHPIPLPPPSSWSCADLDPQVYPPENFTCVDQGFSHVSNFSVPDPTDPPFSQFVLPIDAGCQTVTVFVGGSYFDTLVNGVDLDVYCISLISDDPYAIRLQTAAGRFKVGPDTLTFVLCMDQPRFLGCAVQAWVPGPGYFLWSTTNAVLRTLTTDIPRYDYSVFSGIGNIALSFLDTSFSSVCYDWGTSCPFARATFPADNSLWLFPAPTDYSAALLNDIPFISPSDDMITNISSPMPNRLTLQIYTNYTSDDLGGLLTGEALEAFGTLYLLTVSNADGLPPELPNNGYHSDKFPYLPTLAFSSITRINPADSCDSEKFQLIRSFTDDIIAALQDATDFNEALQLTYDLQVATTSFDYQACLMKTISFLEPITTTTDLMSTACTFDLNTPEYNSDPCCNFALRALYCCAPRPTPFEVTYFQAPDVANITGYCTNPACAASLMGDLADVIFIEEGILKTTCTSAGVQVVESSDPIELVKSCRDASGFGAEFRGVPCALDSDCDFPPYQCNAAAGLCRPPPIQVAEQIFLECFIQDMSISLEDFLREAYLPPNLGSRNSTEFYQAMLQALTQPDCLGLTALDISARSLQTYTSTDPSCKAATFGLSDYSSEVIDALCPGQTCLDYFCLLEPNQCYTFCNAAVSLNPTSQEVCDAQNYDVCSTNLDCSDSNVVGKSVCAYCPADGSLPCQTVPGITQEADCQAQIACELPSGQVVFGLTPSQCATQTAQCSIPCSGGSTCLPMLELPGLCELTLQTTSDDCASARVPFGTFFTDGTCFGYTDDSSICLNSINGAVWRTCESMATCDDSTPASRYLRCAAFPFASCGTSTECAGAGQCSDWKYTYVYDPSRSGQIQTGACFTSGFSQVWFTQGTGCLFGYDRLPDGCRAPSVSTASECTGTAVDPVQSTINWLQWRPPSTTKDLCLDQNDVTSYGCPQDEEARVLWLNSTECEKCGKTSRYAWEWTDGVWQTPNVRNLTWTTTQLTPALSWQNALSFFTLGDWIVQFTLFRSSFALKSQFLCSYETLHYPIQSLSCSCINENSDCFVNIPLATIVGIARPCAQESTQLTTPSAQLYFGSDSISGTCLLIDILEINKDALNVPPNPPSVSFQLASPNTQESPVRNNGGREVGFLMSNGVRLVIPTDVPLSSLEICIEIIPTSTSFSDNYVPDFAQLQPDLSVIPLGYTLFEITSLNTTYWCTNLTDPSTITLFAVMREDNYQSGSYEQYSQQEITLTYVLGALYSFDLLLTTLSMIFLAYASVHSKGSLPIYFWALPSYALLCIFRIVYTFALPSGTWVDDTEGNFVIFELPTFFYFSAVIFTFLALLMVLLRINKNISPWWRAVLWICLVIVWCLFVAVAIAVGVIGNQSDSSPCPGRVPASTKNADQIRALSIAYQSIVIVFCFCLTLGLCIVTYYLVDHATATHGSLRRSLSALREILKDSITIAVGFLTRCVLFIIYLSLDLDSTVFIFITLLITEVLVIMLLNVFWIHRTRNRPHITQSGASDSHGSGTRFTNRASGGSISEN